MHHSCLKSTDVNNSYVIAGVAPPDIRRTATNVHVRPATPVTHYMTSQLRPSENKFHDNKQIRNICGCQGIKGMAQTPGFQHDRTTNIGITASQSLPLGPNCNHLHRRHVNSPSFVRSLQCFDMPRNLRPGN